MKRYILSLILVMALCQTLFAQSEKELFEKGVMLLKKEQFQEALTVFTQFIDLAPENPDAYKNRGLAHMKLGEYDLAILDFEKTREIKPDLKGLYINLGVAWFWKGDYEQAVKNYNMEIALTPDNYYAFFNRAICRAEQDQVPEALEDVNRALAIFPDFYLALCLKGDLLVKSGKTDLARKAYERAVEIDPEHSYARGKVAGLPPGDTKTPDIRKTEAVTRLEAAKDEPTTTSALGEDQKGVVKKEIRPDQSTESSAGYELQAGAYQQEKNARVMEAFLRDRRFLVRVLEMTRPNGKHWFMVRTGRYDTRASAEDARALAMEKTGKEFIIRPYGVF